MKKLKIVACATLIAFSTPVFAKGSASVLTAAFDAIGDVFGDSGKNDNLQVTVAVANDVIAETSGNCNASQSSACQSFSGVAGNQNAGSEQSNTQVSLGWINDGIFINSAGGSATGNSVNQSAAAATGNQNATGLGK